MIFNTRLHIFCGGNNAYTKWRLNTSFVRLRCLTLNTYRDREKKITTFVYSTEPFLKDKTNFSYTSIHTRVED